MNIQVSGYLAEEDLSRFEQVIQEQIATHINTHFVFPSKEEAEAEGIPVVLVSFETTVVVKRH